MSVHAFDDSGSLNRYLLGLSSDEEMAAIEDRLFEDDALFDRVEIAADDLTARYVAETLSPDESARFRARLMGSSDDRIRLRVSRALAAHAARSRADGTSNRHTQPVARRWTSFMAAAAGIAVIGGAGALAWHVSQLRAELSGLRTTLSETEIQSRTAIAEADNRERGERGRREDLERQLAQLTTVAFVVTAGSERGAQSSLVVPKNAAFARLELALERSLPLRCRVVLRNASEATVWSQSVSVAPDAVSIVITIPANLLSTSQYEVIVESIGPGGGATEEAVYGFSVLRR